MENHRHPLARKAPDDDPERTPDRDGEDPDEAPETPLDEPPPTPVKDPPPGGQPRGPYVVGQSAAVDAAWI